MEHNRGGNHKNGYMTAMEFLLKRGIWLRRELHFEAVSKLMEQYAEETEHEFAEWLDKCAYDGHEPDNFYRRQCDLFIESKKEGEAS